MMLGHEHGRGAERTLEADLLAAAAAASASDCDLAAAAARASSPACTSASHLGQANVQQAAFEKHQSQKWFLKIMVNTNWSLHVLHAAV